VALSVHSLLLGERRSQTSLRIWEFQGCSLRSGRRNGNESLAERSLKSLFMHVGQHGRGDGIKGALGHADDRGGATFAIDSPGPGPRPALSARRSATGAARDMCKAQANCWRHLLHREIRQVRPLDGPAIWRASLQ